jgi:hypothetical protein
MGRKETVFGVPAYQGVWQATVQHQGLATGSHSAAPACDPTSGNNISLNSSYSSILRI